MIFKFLSHLAAFVLVPPALSIAQDVAEAPPGVDITNISITGSGCPAGSAGAGFSSDKSSFAMVASKFFAEIGPATGVSKSDTSCAVAVEISIPPGYRTSVSYIRHSGYYELDSAVNYTQKSDNFFQGYPKQMSPNYNVSGPNKGEYAKQANFGPDSDSYAPCGGPTVLKINTEINLNSDDEANLGFSVIDSINVGLQWTECKI